MAFNLMVFTYPKRILLDPHRRREEPCPVSHLFHSLADWLAGCSPSPTGIVKVVNKRRDYDGINYPHVEIVPIKQQCRRSWTTALAGRRNGWWVGV